MSDSAKILFHPHNATHETIIGCSFLGALVILSLLANIYRTRIVNRNVLGPPDTILSSQHERSNLALYAPRTGIRWHHQHAPEVSGDKTLTEAIEDAAAMGRVPQWVVAGMMGRPTSLQHPSIMSVGTALTSEEVTPVEKDGVTPTTATTRTASTTTPTTAETVGTSVLTPDSRIVQPHPNITQVLRPALQPGEAWPLPEAQQAATAGAATAGATAAVVADRPVVRKLSKSRRRSPDGNGRRGKKSVAPAELPGTFGRRSTVSGLEEAVEHDMEATRASEA